MTVWQAACGERLDFLSLPESLGVRRDRNRIGATFFAVPFTSKLESGKNARHMSSEQEKSPDTRTRLIEAAAQEFADPGFFATDTNKIAGRAGFSPKTFYRHFKNKVDVFIAVYGSAVDNGEVPIARLLIDPDPDTEVNAKQLALKVLKFLSDCSTFRLANSSACG